MPMHRIIAALALPILASACAAGSAGPATPRPAVAAPSGGFVAPGVMRAEGIDGIIGVDAAGLTGRFGNARIDLAEGDARKLQFASDDCVLDIFLYPMEAGGHPVATHVAARSRAGGTATDRAVCIAQVERVARSR